MSAGSITRGNVSALNKECNECCICMTQYGHLLPVFPSFVLKHVISVTDLTQT